MQAVFQTLFTYRNAPFKITVDDTVFEVTSLLMAVGNGRYYGGGFKICPDAEIEDGSFDVCIVGDVGKLTTVVLLPPRLCGRSSQPSEGDVCPGSARHGRRPGRVAHSGRRRAGRTFACYF